MFALLHCDEVGMTLTDSLAMHSAASVSSFYLAHSLAQYFNAGRVGNDQVLDMAARHGEAVDGLRRLSVQKAAALSSQDGYWNLVLNRLNWCR